MGLIVLLSFSWWVPYIGPLVLTNKIASLSRGLFQSPFGLLKSGLQAVGLSFY